MLTAVPQMRSRPGTTCVQAVDYSALARHEAWSGAVTSALRIIHARREGDDCREVIKTSVINHLAKHYGTGRLLAEAIFNQAWDVVTRSPRRWIRQG
jgi:hypothetical protein